MVNENNEKLSVRQQIISSVFMIFITGIFVIFSLVVNHEMLFLFPFVMVFSLAIGMGISKKVSK